MAAVAENQYDARLRSEELRSTINYHNRLYYELDWPEVADAVYDELLNELRAIEQQYPELITPDSPTQTDGRRPVDLVRGRGASHAVAQPLELLQRRRPARPGTGARPNGSAATTSPLTSEPKIDGLAISLVYDGRQLRAGRHARRWPAAARTSRRTCARSTRSPSSCGANSPAQFEVRGEVYMTQSGFEAMNAAIGEENLAREAQGRKPLSLYSNPRNAAAGAVRQKDPSVTASRPLSHVRLPGRLVRRAAARRATTRPCNGWRGWGFR